MISKTQLEEALVLAMSNNNSSDDSPPSSSEGAAPQHVQKLSDESTSVEEEVATTTSTEDPPTISPIDPTPSHSSGLQLPLPPHANDDDGDGGVSLEAWSEWDSIPDNASKSSSSTRCATTATRKREETTRGGAIYEEDDGDLPSLSGRRNEPRDANTTYPQHQHRLHNVTTANDPPEYGYRNRAGHNRAAVSTGIHNIQMNSRGHVYLDGEESVANSSNGPPGNLAKGIDNMMSSNKNKHEDDDNESKSTRYSINSNTASSTNSPPPPSDYFHQPSHRQMYPAEPRGGAVDSVGSSEATSIASNTTRSTATTKNSDSRGGVGGNGEYFDGNNGNNSALDRHLSKSSSGRSNNGNSNTSSRRKQDPPLDYTEMIRKQDPHDNAYSSRHASHHRDEMEPFIGRQQQRVVYASSAKRDLYNHNRNTYPDKAKDSDLESGRASSYHHQQQRVRFADKMFSSRENTFSSSTSSSHQVVVGNAPSSSSSSSAYGLSWRDRSVCSDSSATSKSSIDSQTSNSSMSNRIRGSSSNGSRIGGIGRNVVSMLATGLGNIFEGLQPSNAPAPTSNSSTSSNSSGSGGGGARNSNSARFNHLKRYTALLATLSLMMLATIGSYSGAFFGASAGDINDNNADSPRGLGIEHDMRPPAMGLMDNVPHQAMLKGSVGAGLNTNGSGNSIMGGGGGGGLPPLVENGQVVDWDKVPPHLRGYYSKIFGAEASGNAIQQQQQQQQAGQYTQQQQIQEEDPNAAAQAIQSIGNEAIGAESAFKIPTLEQHEFQQHIEELEGAVPFLGKQQQQEQVQQQEVQQQQEQQVQQQDDQEAKQELVKQQLEQVHQRQQAEAEQQRVQAEQQQQEQQQRAQADQQQQEQLKEMSPPSQEESDAAREVNAEEELRRKQAEQEALQKAGIAEEKMKQPQGESEAAAAQNGEANDMNEVIANVEAGGQSNADDANATLESLQSELSELMEKVEQQAS